MKGFFKGMTYGISREQSCILCHLSSGCGGCCNKCKAHGDNGACYGQSCSLPFRDHEGVRWDTWMHLVSTSFPELRKFIPKKYLPKRRQKKQRL